MTDRWKLEGSGPRSHADCVTDRVPRAREHYVVDHVDNALLRLKHDVKVFKFTERTKKRWTVSLQAEEKYWVSDPSCLCCVASPALCLAAIWLGGRDINRNWHSAKAALEFTSLVRPSSGRKQRFMMLH